jgi:hypothetical protein
MNTTVDDDTLECTLCSISNLYITTTDNRRQEPSLLFNSHLKFLCLLGAETEPAWKLILFIILVGMDRDISHLGPLNLLPEQLIMFNN